MIRKFSGFLLLYLIAWCVSPPLGSGALYRLLVLLIVGGMIVFFHPQGFRFSRQQFLSLILIAYIVFLTFVTGDSLSYRIGILILLAFSLLDSCAIQKNKRLSELSWLIPGAFALCIVWNICTLQGLQEAPNIMRDLAKNTSFSVAYARRGVGGYGYLYTILLLLPIGLDWSFDSNKGIRSRLVAVVYSISSYVVVFRSQYFMAILISMIIPLLFGISSVKDMRIRIILLIVSIAGFIVAFANIDAILDWFSNLFGTTGAVARKIQGIDRIVDGGSIEDSDFSARLERYMRSISLAFTNPFWGTLSYTEVGKHSTILDILAQYGLFAGGGLIYVLFFAPFKGIIRKKAAVYVTYVIVLIVALLNQIPFAAGSVIFILLPIYKRCVKRGKT